VGDTRDRPLCDAPVSGGIDLCDPRPVGSSGGFSGCLLQGVVLSPSLNLPAPGADSSRSSTPQLGLGDLPSYRASVGASVLETTHQGTGDRALVEDTRPGISSQHGDGPSTRQCGSVKFGGMEDSGWLHQTSNWDPENRLLLQSAWRQSTLKSHRATWNRWQHWSRSSGVSTDDPIPQNLAQFICYLAQSEGLADRTICLHMSVVVTFANPDTNANIRSSD